jgi:hypothetical protein
MSEHERAIEAAYEWLPYAKRGDIEDGIAAYLRERTDLVELEEVQAWLMSVVSGLNGAVIIDDFVLAFGGDRD